MDGWSRDGVQASGWRWVGSAASVLGTSHTRAAFSHQQEPPPRDKKRNFITGSQSDSRIIRNEHWHMLICHLSLLPRCIIIGNRTPIGGSAETPPPSLKATMFPQVPPGRVQREFTAHTVPQQPQPPTLQRLIYSKRQP